MARKRRKGGAQSDLGRPDARERRPLTNRRRAIAIGASAFAIGAGIARAQTPAAALPIRVGAIPIEASGEAYYSEDGGFFKKAGLDAKIETMSNAGALVAAAVAGAIDVVPSNCVTMAQAYAKGLPVCVVAPGALYSDRDPTTELAVAADSAYRNPKDLNGKRIGVLSLGGLLQLAVQEWLDRNGGDSKTVTFLELPTPQIVPALQAKRIDAGGLPEPFLSSALANRDVRFIGAPYSSIGKSLLLSVWVANRTWVQANVPTVMRFTAAMRMTADWANRNKRTTAAVLAQHTRISQQVIEGMRRDEFALRTDPATIQPVVDVCAKYNLIPRRFLATELFVPNIN